MNDTERLKQIRARCDAATPGPWRGGARDVLRCYREVQPGVHAYGTLPHANREFDAAFIAASREDVPFLLATVEQLVERNADLEPIEQRAQEALLSGNKIGRYILRGVEDSVPTEDYGMMGSDLTRET